MSRLLGAVLEIRIFDTKSPRQGILRRGSRCLPYQAQYVLRSNISSARFRYYHLDPVLQDKQERGRDVEGIIKQWLAFVKPNYVKVHKTRARTICCVYTNFSQSTLTCNGKPPIS